MDIESFRNYCLSKKGTSEDLPFDDVTLVFRVMNKIFAITTLDNPRLSVNLKCDPEKATLYREMHVEVAPGYHMNKRHWNTVDFEGDLTEEFLCKLIDHSYELVVQGLRKKDRAALDQL